MYWYFTLLCKNKIWWNKIKPTNNLSLTIGLVYRYRLKVFLQFCESQKHEESDTRQLFVTEGETHSSRIDEYVLGPFWIFSSLSTRNGNGLERNSERHDSERTISLLILDVPHRRYDSWVSPKERNERLQSEILNNEPLLKSCLNRTKSKKNHQTHWFFIVKFESILLPLKLILLTRTVQLRKPSCVRVRISKFLLESKGILHKIGNVDSRLGMFKGSQPLTGRRLNHP